MTFLIFAGHVNMIYNEFAPLSTFRSFAPEMHPTNSG
uniref:Uncharacterized protein n=1 Tax=Arundo donax TaxID=35708 RepID=A0A0A9FGW9_ARUDO